MEFVMHIYVLYFAQFSQMAQIMQLEDLPSKGAIYQTLPG